ncbi:FitA-like ribbon-helix-helix domain-containing protein [Trichothermofontia sp.]
MTNITLENLDPQLADRLQQRAQQNGRTIAAEITAILASVLVPETSQTSPPGLATAIQQHFADIDNFEIPQIPREPIRTPPTF